MGATFSRLKNWVAEILTYADLNAEIDNILTNLTPAGVDDYSQNATEMQTQTDPGELGTESLSTSLAGEIERLRFMLNEIIGKTQWYESPSASIEELNTLISTSGNRIVSGKSRAGSSQLVALVPDGTAATVVLEGSVTNFVYKIDGTQYTISTDVSLASLQTAPATNNTALVDDATLAGADATKTTGENRTTLTIGTVGSEISGLVGKRAAFKIVGGGTEYFTAFISSSTTLTDCRRGFFFDDNDAPLDRTTISDGDTITLMKLTWIYANTAGAIVASYTEPIYDVETPTPTLGQYWFDLTNDTWKVGNGASFDAANAILIGQCFQDGTGCIGGRSFDKHETHDDLNSPQLEYVSATVIRTDDFASAVMVFGTLIKIDHDRVIWDITADLDSGVSEGASTTYYAYLDELGNAILSDVPPYDRVEDLSGFYHPHQTWRCLGSIDNDGSSNFDTTTLVNYGQIDGRLIKDASITAAKLAFTIGELNSIAFTASNTWDVPAGVDNVLVLGCGGGSGGGGGGGGYVGYYAAAGGGGGQGAQPALVSLATTPAETLTITVGAGGTGGAGGTSGTPGTNGVVGLVGNESIVSATSRTLRFIGSQTVGGGGEAGKGIGGGGSTGGTTAADGIIVAGNIYIAGGAGGNMNDPSGPTPGVDSQQSIYGGAAAGGAKANSTTSDGGGGGAGGPGFGNGSIGGIGALSGGAAGAGTAGAANSGSGGGGGGGGASGGAGAGGGAGGSGHIEIFWINPE